jgi:hypothetical protein
MPLLFLALLIPVFIGCASSVRQAEPVAETPALPECRAGEFSGVGIGESENAALAEAHSALARQISSSVNVTIERTVSQQVSNGREDLNTGYGSRAVIESSLPNAHDARIAGSIRSGGKTSVAVCMAKADAAKGFIERQRLVMDSLEMASSTALTTEHPRHKNEAWHRTQMLYNDFIRIQHLLDGWGVGSPYSADEVYAKTRADYSNYCRDMKLHWNPEIESLYSEIAFAKLSQKVKIEKSPCADRGVSLAYRGSEPDCSVKFGLNTCSYPLSLSLRSCDGTEYLQLNGDAMGAHQKPDFALEKLQGNLKSAEFWNQWGQEIKQWSPQCE